MIDCCLKSPVRELQMFSKSNRQSAGRNSMMAPKTSGESHPNIGLFRLSLVAILVGAVTGFGAIGFRGLIGFIHNLFFLGRLSFLYDANTFTPASPWGI